MPGKARLKWITVLLPVLFVMVFENFRLHVLRDTFRRPTIEIISFLILTGAALFFSLYVFRAIDSANRNLFQEQQKIKALFNNSSDAMVILDDRTYVVAMNPAAEELVGWSTEEAVGKKTCQEIFSCAGADDSLLSADRCCGRISIQTGRPVPYVEMTIMTRDRRRIPITGSCSPIDTPDECRHAAIVLRDMSEKRKMELEIEDLYREALKHTREAETLYEIGVLTSSILDLDRNLPGVLERVQRLFGADLVALGSVEAEQLRWLRQLGGLGGTVRGALEEGSGLLAGLLRTGEPAMVGDGSALEAEDGSIIRREGLQVILAVPLSTRGPVFGVLLLGKRQREKFTDADLRLLATIGNQLATALENARLYEQVQNTAVLEERERIAREMHDGMAQSLSYLNFQLTTVGRMLQRANYRAAAREVEEMRHLIEETYADARQAIFDLKMETTERGFIPYLQQYVAEFGRRNKVEAVMELQEEFEPELDTTVEIQLVRIVQEALTNIRKHAQASRIRVDVYKEGGSLRISIVDDGIGFKRTGRGSPDGRFGLAIMRERAESVGGEFELHSSPGEGTRVSVRVPLAPEGGILNGSRKNSVG